MNEHIEELKNMGVADADIPQILATEQASGHTYREYWFMLMEDPDTVNAIRENNSCIY